MKTRITEMLGIRYPIIQGGMQLKAAAFTVRWLSAVVLLLLLRQTLTIQSSPRNSCTS